MGWLVVWDLKHNTKAMTILRSHHPHNKGMCHITETKM
jgi:hypothetical protein